jgi:DNA polymerase III delta subunit
VVVDHAEQAIKEEARAVLERYVQSPSENATLVLRCVRWYPGKLDEMIAKVGTKIELEAITHEKAVIWTTRRAEKRHGAHVEPGAAEQLVTKLGVELGRIDTELEKLATFAGGGSPASPGQAPVRITEAMVAELVGMTREEEAWGLQDSILSGDAERALAHLRLILDNSRKDAAVPLSWACLDLARKLHSASRALKQGENAWSLAGRLRIFGTSRDQILATAGRVPPARMAAILKEAVASDLASKSGLGDPDRNLERLTLRFARALRG